ncbi:hypothetical protein ES707_07377 [subsurface metagenome]
MRFKFWQRQPDFFEEMPRGKRPRETLTQLSEKLIMKQMKANPTYGLQMAEKVKKVAKVEDKSLLSQVKELRQIQTALRELGVGGEEQQGMLAGLFDRETIQTILATIVQALGKGQPLPQIQQPPQQEQLSQPERQQLTQPTDETIRMPSLSELLPYLEMPPEDVVALLKERQEAGDEQAILWLNLLSKSSYKQICQLLRPVQETNPELESLIFSLLHESREKWWRELLEGVKRAI